MDASRDGERILVAVSDSGDGQVETRPRVTVVMNWLDQLERRVGGEPDSR
jgi:hypothetical protein